MSHEPVLLDEVVDVLARRPSLAGARFVDCTLGGAGHARALLEAVPDSELLGLDRDPAAVARCRAMLAPFGSRVDVRQGDYRELARLIKKNWSGRVDGLVADLGLSSFQLADADRGFAFAADGPLDMRFDPDGGGLTAADLVRDLSERELEALLRELADEPHARRIARELVRTRREAPVTRTTQLAALVAAVTPRPPAGAPRRIHPATRTFQALRIAVNRELEGLDGFVRDAAAGLSPGGRLAIISFHGGEDRAVKNALKDLAGRCTCPPELPRCECGRHAVVRVITRRPVRPSEEEAAHNPRARSARLRVAEKLAA